MNPNDEEYKNSIKLSAEGLRRLSCGIENTTPCGLSFNEMMKELSK